MDLRRNEREADGGKTMGLPDPMGITLLPDAIICCILAGACVLVSGCLSEVQHFTDVTREAGLADFTHENGASGLMWMPEILPPGLAFVDYNGDSHPDIALVQGSTWDSLEAQPPAIRLYANNGSGYFSEVTQDAGLEEVVTYGMGIASADYDNDGDADLFLTSLGHDILLRNNDGVYTVTQSGAEGPFAWSTAAVFLDADRDGWLDLYVGGYVRWSPEADLPCQGPGEEKIYCTPAAYDGQPHRFYHNNADGTFSDWTEEAGFLSTPGKTLGAVLLDVNDDLWPDLAVANDLERDQLYINQGDGTFIERGLMAGIAYDARGIATAGMGIDAGIISGEWSILVGNFSNQMISVWQYAGGGVFRDRASATRIGGASRQTLAFGLFLFDADLDGDEDVFVANGHIHEHVEHGSSGIKFYQRPHLFKNMGDGVFTDEGNFEPLLGRGAAYADIDQDGDLDILMGQNAAGVRLWRNNMQGRYLRVRLEGMTSNRDGVGAHVSLYTSTGLKQRHVRSGGSYLSESERVLTFGLGVSGIVDSLHVRWPSGQRSQLIGPLENTFIVVREGTEE